MCLAFQPYETIWCFKKKVFGLVEPLLIMKTHYNNNYACPHFSIALLQKKQKPNL